MKKETKNENYEAKMRFSFIQKIKIKKKGKKKTAGFMKWMKVNAQKEI